MTREEAINEVKKAMPTMWKETKEALSILIPELAESEDERIRKEMIAYFEDIKEVATKSKSLDEWIAWLEKQKVKERFDRMAPIYNDKESFESALEKAWKYYNESASRTVDSFEDDYIECVFSKGFREGFLYKEKQKEQKPILEVFGFKVGDAVRLKDGDGRKHIIKAFEEVEGVHGPNFYHVEFEDDSARDGIYPGEEYPNGYYTQMEKFEEEQKTEWSKEDKNIIEGMIVDYKGEIEHLSDSIIDEQVKPVYQERINFLNRLKTYCPESYNNDVQKKIEDAIYLIEHYSSHGHDKNFREKVISELKSLRPQSHKKIHQAAKHDIAIKFMKYLDENRPEGKMSLSNSECEDIDKAFKENDWAKIIRYVEKFKPHWKPSKEQMDTLRDVVINLQNIPWAYNPLKELYEQLNKQ